MNSENRLVGKPVLCDAKKAHTTKLVQYDKKGRATINFKNEKKMVPLENQFDLTQGTIFGLNERLTDAATSPKLKKGQTLRSLFNLEWNKYQKALEQASGHEMDYGIYAYYERANHLVKYCDPFWHKVVSVASTSMLLRDPKKKLSWSEVRERLDNFVIGVVGASVGNSIIHTLVQDMRPNAIKIADKSLYKLENINRVRLTYFQAVEDNSRRESAFSQALRNKAEVTAEQLYAINPFQNVYTYTNGINTGNIESFFKGNGKEPKIDLLVEEVDDPALKLTLREYARKQHIPLLMVSDFGSSVQLDINRNDLYKNLSLTFGSSDENLKTATSEVLSRPGERDPFFQFVNALAGKHYMKDELADILSYKSEIPTSTIIPQMGSTISAAAGIMSETVARIALGWKNHPKRMVFNKRDFTVKIYS